MYNFLFALLITVLAACLPTTAVADSDDGLDDTFNGSEAESDDSQEQGSDASFDKRLPPVLPGESIGTGKKKMKVWSTSGPVPVNEPPDAPSAPQLGAGNTQPNIGSVIVDDRDRRE